MRFSGKHLPLMLSAMVAAILSGCTVETPSPQNAGTGSGGESSAAPVTDRKSVV